MPSSAPKPAPVPPTLADQKADFTAEGAPPPGKVATTAPVTPAAEAPDASTTAPASKPSPKPGPDPAVKPALTPDTHHKASKHKQAG